jgi:hypothetical protein
MQPSWCFLVAAVLPAIKLMRCGAVFHSTGGHRPSNVGSTSKVCHNGSTHNSGRDQRRPRQLPPGILNFAFCRGEIAAPVPIAALTQ